jgi:hypothetical protein
MMTPLEVSAARYRINGLPRITPTDAPPRPEGVRAAVNWSNGADIAVLKSANPLVHIVQFVGRDPG